MRNILFIALSIFVLQTAAQSYRNTYAVVIGIADYEDFNILSGDLSFTINDARKFTEFLMSKEGGQVPAENIYLLTNEKARKANIILYTKKLFSRAQPDDRVIFFYSGHGAPGAFMPYDVSKTGTGMLHFSEVKELFRSANCKTKLLFADACHSGSLKNSASKSFTESIQLEKSVEKETGINIAIMLSSRANETSIERKDIRQGLFSYYLIQALSGKADSNGDRIITIKEAFYFVYKQTVSKAKKQSRHKQHPILFGDFDMDMVVAKVY